MINTRYSYRLFFEVWLISGRNITEKNKVLEDNIVNSFSEEHLQKYRQDIIKNISRFCGELAKRWEASSRNKDRFLKKK